MPYQDSDHSALYGWMLGSYSSYELINALAHHLRALCELQGKVFTDHEFALLEDGLNRNRFARFASIDGFLLFAERMMFSQGATAAMTLDARQSPIQQPRPNFTAHFRFNRVSGLGTAHETRISSEANREAAEESLRKLDATIDFLERDSIENPAKDETVSFASPGFFHFSTLNEAEPTEKKTITGDPSEILGLVETLRSSDPEFARFAVFRLFGGLTLREISSRTSVPIAVVNREWSRLRKELLQRGLTAAPSVSLITPDETLLKAIRAHPELLKTLDWRLFEKVLAVLLERLGFEIELQNGTKDGGIDIFAIKSDPALGAHRYLIQAKRWSHRVGVEPVRELLFLQGYYRVSKGCLATTATFTRGALRLAEEYRWQLELKDYCGLRDWVERATVQGGESANNGVAADGLRRR